MKDQTNAQPGSAEENNGERPERPGQRKEAFYSGKGQLSFDPLKDLNLPGSYEEVIARFKRLQVMRAMEALN